MQSQRIMWGRILGLTALVFLVLYVLSRLIPCYSLSDYPVGDDLENAWTEALHEAFIHGFQFGREIVFTYGPWGFLARGYHPQTFVVAYGVWVLLAAAYLVIAWRAVVKSGVNPWLAGIGLVFFTGCMTLPPGEDFNNRVLAMCMLWLVGRAYLYSSEFSRFEWLWAFVLSWMGLVKFTAFIEVGVLVTILGLQDWLKQRRFPWVIVSWLAGLIFFWSLAGQNPVNLPGYLLTSWRITQGYTEAMSFWSEGETMRLAIFLAVAALECALLFGFFRQQDKKLWFLPASAVLVFMLMAFKSGYVRTGWQHETTSAVFLLLIATICLALPAVNPILKWLRPLNFIAALMFVLVIFGRWFPGDGFGRQFFATLAPANVFAPISVLSSDYLKQRHADQLARWRSEANLPEFKEGADIYNYEQGALFASGSAYQPRPVFQSYSAYAPDLAAFNADHLKGSNAAGDLLFAVQTIDGRFPPLDDGLSWPELLARYDAGAVDGRFLHLKRSAISRGFKLVSIGQTSAQLGRKIQVPIRNDAMIWSELDIRPTPAGKFYSIVYKPARLSVVVELESGDKQKFRLIPQMARAGFLLSPAVTNTAAFAALMRDRWSSELASHRVKSIEITEDIGHLFSSYKTGVDVRFYQLEITPPVAATNSTAEER